MRKKLIIALVAIMCISLVACAAEPEGTTVPQTTAGVPNEPFEITFDPDREDLPDRAAAERITEGMSVREIYSIMGLPQSEYYGKGSLEWTLDNGEVLIVLFDKEYKSHIVNVGWAFKTDPDREDLPERATAEQIAEGMWIGDVYAIMGLPQRDTGSGEVYMEWDLKTGEILRIRFDHKLDDNRWYVDGIIIG